MLNADKANILRTATPMYKMGDVWKRRRHGRKTRGQSQNSDAGSSALRGKVRQRITALEKSRSLLVCLEFFHPITITVCGPGRSQTFPGGEAVASKRPNPPKQPNRPASFHNRVSVTTCRATITGNSGQNHRNGGEHGIINKILPQLHDSWRKK